MFEEQRFAIPPVQPRQRKVGDVIPGVIPALLGVFQMILWLAIIGLESASVYYDAGRGTIYAGFWCSGVFLVTWISMFCYLCCNKATACGIYLLIQNIINLIFVIILIIFTSRFINNPCLCYGRLCDIQSWDYYAGLFYEPGYGYLPYQCTGRTFQKLPVLKGLLSCAVFMLVSNIIFIGIYLAVFIWLRVKPMPYTGKQTVGVPPYQPSPAIYVNNQYQQPMYLTPSMSEPHYYSSDVETIPQSRFPRAPVEIRSEKF